ncbi:MAG: RNase adapter RapZ [Trichlorobacter sp.]|nr:RNase adapter RapZ [Trichlorobacter sp.]
MRILVVTGMSGSGKSTVVKALEDEGFYCIDNLPVGLFRQFTELLDRSGEQFKGTVLVTDIRGRNPAKDVIETCRELRTAGHQVEIIFLDASDEILIRRYSETRRRHPAGENYTVTEGIRAEREKLALLRQHATSIIDTSEFNVHQLRAQIVSLIRGEQGKSQMQIELISFGFRYGVPLDASLVMDVRFLPNPHFIPHLRPHNGTEKQIQDFLLAQNQTTEFMGYFNKLLDFLIPAYKSEGKSYLTIAIGCTGGRHRSVALVEFLSSRLANAGMNVRTNHRDMEKG